MLLLCAIAAASSAWFAASRLPLIVAGEVTGPDAIFSRVVVQQAIGVALLLLPMTFALGIIFPLALALASDGSADIIGRDVARVYAANTLGAIGGALAGGFLLVPIVGLRATVLSAAVLGILCGVVCLARTAPIGPPSSSGTADTVARRTRELLIPAAAGAVAIAVIMALPRWDRALLTSGAYKYAPVPAGARSRHRAASRPYPVLQGGRGRHRHRARPRRHPFARDRRQGGRVECGRHADAAAARPAAAAAAQEPGGDPRHRSRQRRHARFRADHRAVHRADVVEISPEVVEASAFFDKENGHALQRPGMRLIVGDGRSHLKLHAASLRRDRVRAVESVDGRRRRAFTREFFESRAPG